MTNTKTETTRFAALKSDAQRKAGRELFAAHGEYWIGAARFSTLDEVARYLASLTSAQAPAMTIVPAIGLRVTAAQQGA